MGKKIQIAWVMLKKCQLGYGGQREALASRKVTKQGYRTTEAKQISLQMS